MRRAVLPVLVAAIVPAASSLAQTSDEPVRKPGWWEMQLLISGPTPQPIRQTMHICTDPAVDKVRSPLGVNMNGGSCPPTRITRTAAGWTISGSCDTGTMKVSAVGVATGDFNDRYHVDIVTHMDPPPAPQAGEVKVGIDARWVGQCPADKKPGDIEIVTRTNVAPKGPG